MKKPVKKTEKIIASIISKLSCGATLTNICRGADMPTLRAVQLWREHDAELEERIHAAWLRGLQTRFDMNYDDQQRLLDNHTNYDPKYINAMATITRDRSHQIMAAQTRLDKRYAVQRKTKISGSGPFVVGWQETPTATPTDDFPLSGEPKGGEARR